MTNKKHSVGSIQKLGDNHFRVRVTVGYDTEGRPQQVAKIVHGPRKEADKALAKLVADNERGTLVMASGTLGDLLARWCEHVASIDRSPTTLREYRRLVGVITEDIGSIKLAKLGGADLDRYYAILRKRGLSPSSIRRYHAAIGAAIRQGERWGLVSVNVARRASPPPVRSVPVQPPTPDELRAMIKAAQADAVTDLERQHGRLVADMLTVTALTGARRGELCALQFSDWDRDAGALRIERSAYEVGGGGVAFKQTKSYAGRTVSLDPVAVHALSRRWEDAAAAADAAGIMIGDSAFIFSDKAGGAAPMRPDRMTKLATTTAQDAGVSDTHLHSLRHFAASQMVAAGVDIVTVAHRLGHKDPSVTLRIYSHFLPQKDAAAAIILGQLLTGEAEALPA